MALTKNRVVILSEASRMLFCWRSRCLRSPAGTRSRRTCCFLRCCH